MQNCLKNWNLVLKEQLTRKDISQKCRWKDKINTYITYVNDPSFQGVNRLFDLPFQDSAIRIGHSRYFIPAVKINGYNVSINGKNFFDQPVKIDLRKYDNNRKIATGQWDYYTTGCLLLSLFQKIL